MNKTDSNEAVICTTAVTHRYGNVPALDQVNLSVPRGAVYALLGPNGSGKSTLLQIVVGLLNPSAGMVSILGKDVRSLTAVDRSRIGYMADGMRLPSWMTLGQLEAFVSPLYETWDGELADDLRDRFNLNPERKIKTLSRGEYVKAALLCTLAPRPELIILDEPFNGIDVVTKDDLVRGLLESSGREGWTVVVASHDISELELLVDWVGFLDRGRLTFSDSMENIREQFKRVEVIGPAPDTRDEDWLSVEQAGNRMTFVTQAWSEAELRSTLPAPADVSVRAATLREVFVALAGKTRSQRHEVAR